MGLQFFLLAISESMLILSAVVCELQISIFNLGQSEAVARRQYAEIGDLYRNAPLGLAFLDTRQVYLQVNDFLARIHGVPAEAHIGHSVREILPAEVAEAGEAVFKRVIETGEPDLNREVSGPTGEHPNEIRHWLVGHYPVKEGDAVIGVNVILKDITERKRAEEEINQSRTLLQVSLERIQDLAGRLIQVQEVERARIARDLHDDVNQQLAALSMAISGIKRRLSPNAEVRKELEAVQQRAIGLTDEVRRVSHGLHSGVLQHAGLVPALRAQCSEFQQAHGIKSSFLVDEKIGDVPANVSLCLYRVVQEAMANVSRHARAAHADVRLGQQDGGLELKITDDGKGFDPSGPKATRGLGLISIEERVRMVGGRVNVESRPQGGTMVRVWVPRE
jgi:PAS domain S-box-containing protein